MTGDKTEVISLQFINQAPILTQIGNKTINEGEQLQFTINAIDPDGDNLTYSASNLPSAATFRGVLFSQQTDAATVACSEPF